MEIREIVYEELKEASAVLWKSFYAAEKTNHSLRGMERFRDLTSPVSLSINTFDGRVQLFGLFSQGKMLGVGALKEKKHILLLYVLPECQRSGFGSALLKEMERMCLGDCITLNSSDFAVPFYEKRGYCIKASRQVEEELIFTPMEKKR